MRRACRPRHPAPSATTPVSRSTTAPSSTTSGVKTDRLTIHDYLWRWDTDWFWCSGAFGAQHPLVRRFWPRRYLRSSSYWKLMRLERRFDIGDRLEKLHGRPPRERVIQDIEVPIERCAEFLDWFLGERADRADLAVPAATARRRRAGRSTRSGRARRTSTSASGRPCRSGRPKARRTGMIERRVSELDGHKSLYSDAFYSRGGVRRALRRGDLPGGEEAVRPRLATARPLCEGGATAMTTFKERDGCAVGPEATERGCRRNGARGRESSPSPRSSRSSPAAGCRCGFTAYDGSSAGPARRAVRPGPEDTARHDLSRHRVRRSRARPRLHRR